MRTSVLLTVLAGLLIAALAIRDAQLRRRIEATTTANQALAEKLEAASQQLAETQDTLEKLRPADINPLETPQLDAPPNSAVANRLAELENRVQTLTKALAQRNSSKSFPEFDPTRPPAAEPVAPVMTNSTPRRSWGEEQIIGPPDTERAGDIPTAWASREPDAGPEWLAAGFDSVVDVAEVRIRESFNPGAIAKVTAMVNGQEVVLWEGTATGGAAPRDFVVRPEFSVSANSVIVHLDTARVAGWNEIDAVELVGRDGTRQWTTSANASSTYAVRHPPENQAR